MVSLPIIYFNFVCSLILVLSQVQNRSHFAIQSFIFTFHYNCHFCQHVYQVIVFTLSEHINLYQFESNLSVRLDVNFLSHFYCFLNFRLTFWPINQLKMGSKLGRHFSGTNNDNNNGLGTHRVYSIFSILSLIFCQCYLY